MGRAGTRVIAHEIGHIFDFNTASNDPARYKSRTFVDVLNPGECNTGILGCLGFSPPAPGIYPIIDKLTGGGGVGQYNPIGKLRDYGRGASIDDFADSFARHTLDKPGIGSTIPFYQIRETIISVWVDMSIGIK